MRFEPNPENAKVPWFYHGQPCQVTGLEVENGKVNGIYIKKNEHEKEILCLADESGKFVDLEYGSN